MLLIIGRTDERMIKFAKRINGKTLVTDRACELSKITEPVTVIIPFEKVAENGFVTNTRIFFDELFITCKVDQVVASLITTKMINTCAHYNVPLERLEL